jgi:hypothetical protein
MRFDKPDEEYERDRAFVLALLGVFDSMVRQSTTGVDPQDEPLSWVAGLEKGLAEVEAKGRKIARIGMRMALQDVLEMTRGLTPDSVKAVDEAFDAGGLPTLSGMRRRVWKTIPKVLKRGRIRNEAEYYLLIERLNDVDDSGLSGEDRERLGLMVVEFEQRPKRSELPPG